MPRVIHHIDGYWRINLFMVAIHGLIMQYLCQHYRKPRSNNYVYGDRNECIRMPQYGYCDSYR
jgi:hypothetical protein